MQRLFWLLLLALLLVFPGCTRVSEEDLGEVLDELPKVAAEEPYVAEQPGLPLSPDPTIEPPP